MHLTGHVFRLGNGRDRWLVLGVTGLLAVVRVLVLVQS